MLFSEINLKLMGIPLSNKTKKKTSFLIIEVV